MAKKIILGAAAACAALVGLSATAASADPWQWRPRYDADDYYRSGYSTRDLFQREDRMGDQIRRLSADGRFNRWEASQAWRGLSEARMQTQHEAREHGPMLPPDDYFRISQRLDNLERFIRHEARDWD